MKSDIIIVGNGSSLLERELGDQIDNYNSVVRFNAFEIKNFEKYVGTKSTIWFNVVAFKKPNWKIFHAWEKIYLHSWQWDITQDQFYIEFAKIIKDSKTNLDILTKISKKTIEEIILYSGDDSYQFFSTGLIAIWEMLKIYPTVDVVGFDWWDYEKHHYNDNAIRGTLHKPQKEKAILNKLMLENKVNFI